MKTIRDRLNDLIAVLKLSKNEFAREIGSNGAMISKITTKDVNFGIDVFKKIIDRYPQLNHQWLMSGEGEMWLENHNNEVQLRPQQTAETDRAILKKLTEQFPSDYKPMTEDEWRGYRENRKLIERNKQKLINELASMKGDLDGLYTVLDKFASIKEMLSGIEFTYLDELDDVLFHADEYLTSDGFNYKKYKADSISKLNNLKTFKSPISTLLFGVHQFMNEFKKVDTKKALEEFYEVFHIKEV